MFNQDPIIVVSNSDIYQNTNLVLSNVTFKVEKGEFVYVVGQTGCGKSSLLKMLYADLKLNKGNATVAGFLMNNIEASKIPYLRRKLGIIFQDFQLLGDRSIGDNLAFVLKSTGWTDSIKIKIRINEVLMKVGLSGHIYKFPHQLSGGEQQRVAIARSLLNDPLLVIADEPTGNLDNEVSVGIMKIFKDINRSGTAVLMATHNLNLIKEFPGRVLTCKDGKLEENNGEKTTIEETIEKEKTTTIVYPE